MLTGQFIAAASAELGKAPEKAFQPVWKDSRAVEEQRCVVGC